MCIALWSDPGNVCLKRITRSVLCTWSSMLEDSRVLQWPHVIATSRNDTGGFCEHRRALRIGVTRRRCFCWKAWRCTGITGQR